MPKDNRLLMVDSWIFDKYTVLNESDAQKYQNESAFQNAYANVSKIHNPKILCVIEGRFGRNNCVSVNGRYYGDFWEKQLAKEQTQFLLRKGLMYMMFGHVNRGIEDKDVEDGTICGIVTHLEVVKEPITIHGKDYEAGDLFGRAIIISMGGKNVGESVHTLLSVGSEISISSRGLGEYLIGETYQTEDGQSLPIMNPDTYELETFDLTRLPGISCAEVHLANVEDAPSKSIQYEGETENDDEDFYLEASELTKDKQDRINESINSLIFTINKEKENNMPKVDTIKIQQVLEDANAKIATLTAQNESLSKKLEDAEAERDAEKAKADELEEKMKEQTTEDADEAPVEDEKPVEDKPEEDKPAAEVTEDEDKEELCKFKEIAKDPQELQEALNKAYTTLQKCECDAKELKELKEENEQLKADMEEKDKDLKEAEQALESYVKLGSITALTAIVETNKKLVKESRDLQLSKLASHYSNKKGITLESVKRIMDSSKSIKDAKLVLESLPNKDVTKKLYKGESAQAIQPVQSQLSTFAESFILKEENRRTARLKSYSAE